jgi:hypothetical protein
MQRRHFFGWVGKISALAGLGFLFGRSSEIVLGDESQKTHEPPKRYMTRMNARACHDYRMISDDHSIVLDREIFHT